MVGALYLAFNQQKKFALSATALKKFVWSTKKNVVLDFTLLKIVLLFVLKIIFFSSVADSTKNVKRYRAQRFKYARN
jgi:hypothetical protein